MCLFVATILPDRHPRHNRLFVVVTQAYTGTHKHRFDATGMLADLMYFPHSLLFSIGKGRGLAGRDSVALGQGTVNTYRGGNVTNLSQILRN